MAEEGGARRIQGTPPRLALAAIVGVAPLATDMYIPALPAIARDLHSTTSIVQLSLTAFLVSFAVGQFLIGPLSDALGRRRLLLIATAVFTLGSIGCTLAPTAETLILARILQGLAGAAGSVSGRAMVSDVTTGIQRTRVFATLAAITSLGPVVAPLVGGALVSVAGWRATFATLAILGLVLFVTVWLRFAETLPPERRSVGIGLGANVRRMGTLLRIPRFSLYLLASALGTVGFFSYISTSSFVFQEQFGFTELAYTIVFAVNATCMICSTLVFRRIVGRGNENRLVTLGFTGATIGAVVLLASAVLGLGPIVFWICLASITTAWGFIGTGTMTRTQAVGSQLPGTASALQGAVAFGCGGLATPLAGLLGGDALALSIVMCVGVTLALIVQLLATWRFGDGSAYER